MHDAKPRNLKKIQGPTRRVVALAGVAMLAACGGGGGGGTPLATAPTLLIRSDATGEVRGNFNVQFFFSVPVSFASSTGILPFSLAGASVVPNSFKQLSSDSWQVTLAPDTNKQGLVDLRVPPGAFTDPASGLSNTVAYEFGQPYNTLVPYAKLEFGGPVNALGMITGAGTFTLRFDAVLDAPLTVDKISYTAGTIGQFVKTSGTGQKDAYTFVFSPPPATSGAVTFEIAKGAVTSGGIPNNRDWWSFGLATA